MTRVALALLLLALVRGLAAQPLLAYDSGNPPMMFARGDRALGVYPELLQVLGEAAGLSLRHEAMPWVRVLRGLEQGRQCAVAAYRTPERDRLYLRSQVLQEDRTVVLVRADSALRAVGSLRALAGLRVGVHRAWSYGGELDSALRQAPFSRVPLTHADQLLLRLQAGRLDAVLTDNWTAAYLGPRLGLSLREAGILTQQATYLICPRTAEFQSMLARLDAVLQARRDSGELKQQIDASLRRLAMEKANRVDSINQN